MQNFCPNRPLLDLRMVKYPSPGIRMIASRVPRPGRMRRMAVSTCAKCNGHSFELALSTPIGESKKLTIVQCSSCGTPVGVIDPATGSQIEALKHQIAAIDERLNRIAKALQD